MGLAADLKADPADDFGFDLYVESGQVVVWVDLGQLFGQNQFEQLRDGGNLNFELSFRMVIPRSLVADKTVMRTVQGLAINYNLITETYSASYSREDYKHQLSFFKAEELSKYLSDSVTFQIGSYEELEPDRQYVLKAEIVRLSLSERPKMDEDDEASAPGSLLKSVFAKFLDLTSFGRQEFTAESRPLLASELAD